MRPHRPTRSTPAVRYARQVLTLPPVARARQLTQGVFFGWWIVAGTIGIQILQSGLLMQAYSSYVVFLQAEFGWSKTTLSAAFSLKQAESGLLGPLQGWLLERFGARAVMGVGIVLLGGGFMLFSGVQSLVGFYLAFVVMALGSSLSGFLSLCATLVNWFERRRASVLAIMSMGMSIGGLMVPFVAAALARYGWRATAFGSGLLILAVGLPLCQLMRNRPEDYGLLPDGASPTPTPSPSEAAVARVAPPQGVAFTPRQALRTRAFWFISAGHALALVVVSSVLVHLVPHLNEGLGYTVPEAARVVALMTGITMAGQFLGGVLGDRFNKRLIATLAMFGHAGALLLLAYANTLWMVLLFAVMHGLAWGMRGPIMQALRADYFGRTYFASIMGYSSLIVMLGQIGGPLIAGVLADHLGNYRLGFTVLALLAACGSVFFMLVTPPKPPTDA